MPTPKRFIAGAVCPRCAEMDKLRMYTTDEGDQIRDCVACGFTDAVSDTPTPETAEIETRVNKRDNKDDHTVQQVVFFKSGEDT